MNKTEYSEDPYQDGTVPADADFATSSADGAAAETPDDDTSDSGTPARGEELHGATDKQSPNPTSLVEGNRVATAEDME